MVYYSESLNTERSFVPEISLAWACLYSPRALAAGALVGFRVCALE